MNAASGAIPLTASFSARLDNGPSVRVDGALNTELARKGLRFTTMEWLRVNIDAPDTIAGIHARYARAGAELHMANS